MPGGPFRVSGFREWLGDFAGDDWDESQGPVAKVVPPQAVHPAPWRPNELDPRP